MPIGIPQQVVRSLLYPIGHIDVSRAAIRRIVFEAAVLGRVVRRCDQNAIGKALRPGAIVHQHSP